MKMVVPLPTNGRDFLDEIFNVVEEVVSKYYQDTFLLEELEEFAEKTFLCYISDKKAEFTFQYVTVNLQIKGFLSYIRRENEVSDINLFSFFRTDVVERIHIRRMKKLLSEFVNDPNISKISWSALPANHANQAYQSFIKKHNGTIVNDGGLLNYCIDKNNPINNQR